jgi:hypothetical protein
MLFQHQRVALEVVTELRLTCDATRLTLFPMEANMSTTNAPKTEIRDRQGLIPGVGNLAIDVIDRGQATTLGVLHDARAELRTALDHGIDLADKLAASTFRFAKKLVQRLDDAAADTLGGVERVVGGAIKTARDTTRAGGELAATVANGVVGTRGDHSARA